MLAMPPGVCIIGLAGILPRRLETDEMAKKTYGVWQVDMDSTFRPIALEFKTTSKAKAVKLARALAKSEAFQDCRETAVVCDDTTVQYFKVRRP